MIARSICSGRLSLIGQKIRNIVHTHYSRAEPQICAGERYIILRISLELENIYFGRKTYVTTSLFLVGFLHKVSNEKDRQKISYPETGLLQHQHKNLAARKKLAANICILGERIKLGNLLRSLARGLEFVAIEMV